MRCSSQTMDISTNQHPIAVPVAARVHFIHDVHPENAAAGARGDDATAVTAVQLSIIDDAKCSKDLGQPPPPPPTPPPGTHCRARALSLAYKRTLTSRSSLTLVMIFTTQARTISQPPRTKEVISSSRRNRSSSSSSPGTLYTAWVMGGMSVG